VSGTERSASTLGCWTWLACRSASFD